MPNTERQRWLAGITRAGFFLVLFLAVGWSAPDAGAQDSDKKPPVEEEDPVKRPTRKPPPVDADTVQTTDLLLEAVRATNPDVKELFRRMGTPHDVIAFNDGKKLTVAPVRYYLGQGSTVIGRITVTPFDDQWKPGEKIQISRQDIRSTVHYEQAALSAVEEFLKAAEPRKALTQLERLDAAEKVLLTALRFHRPSPERRARDATKSWNEVESKLQSRLLAVQIDRLQEMSITGNWEDAFAWGDRLTRVYGDADVHKRIVQELGKLVMQALKQEKYEQVQKQLLELERFPNSASVIRPIAAQLHEQAKHLLDQARGAKQGNNPEKANELVNKADRLWPRLEGLRELRWQLNKDHPTLGVGVRELPEFMSPATAVLDSEKQAAELIFESLIEAHETSGGQTYEPQLAVELPRLTPRGREFRIDRDAYWPKGERVTATDVQHTVHLLGRSASSGLGYDGADILEPPTAGRDPSLVHLALRQGFLDPLSLMTFKILPSSENLERADDPRFGKRPIGSGPYQLADASRLQAEPGAVVFVANPSFRRARKPEMPHIQEIRFYVTRDPVADFLQGRLHLLLDVSRKQAEELQKDANGLNGLVTLQTLRNRRVYFLAVNHRRRLLQNTEVRKAIAHAINRTEILQEVFRGDIKSGVVPMHRPLNGPYPLGSWACDPSLAADPWKPELAKTEAKLAREALALANVRLKLKYPENNDEVKDACTRLRDQVQATTGFEIELVPRPGRALRQDVEMDHDYDLAYYAYDFPSEAYCLWPLFNPESRAREPGGSNFLGYHNDGNMESLFNRALGHREFAKVREYTQKIHAEIHAKMPLIPLWQLDTVIAIHKDLAPVRIDPLLIFNDVERWKLGK